VPYDLFISYSRRDDKQGQVRALKQQIEADYRSFTKEDLGCFFDTEDIATMDDWRHRILEGLRESNLLLLVLTPAYLDSSYCEWEIIEFLKYENSRTVGGQGVTPVYFLEIPGLDEPGFEQRAAAWVAQVRRRNQVDLRDWFHEGVDALKRTDVRRRLDDLERSLHTRLSRLRRLREVPGNLPAHNPRFVGRETEMQRLHEAAGLGRFGVLTAVQGMGGVGKTALAFQYAHAYADFYPGGRWLVSCAGETNLASAVRRLDLDLWLTLSDAEQRDDNLAARRVLAELERRAIEGAKSRSGEEHLPEPKALLLLDNVDTPALLQPPQSALLTGRKWLHVLATTRSGAQDFCNDPERLTVLSIDELPDDDALRLIESYQPGGRFPTPQERDAALGLVKLLGGFTLAVEVVAVHLGERAGRVTCAAFLERMKKEGLGNFDDVAVGTKTGIFHGEKLVGATLTPTLDLLSEPERLVLSYASLLPPDSIPLPWLRALTAKNFPELGRDAEPGCDDPWINLINNLLGLRLLHTIDFTEDGRTPRLLRMHRLVGGLVRSSDKEIDHRRNWLSIHAHNRCSFLEKGWLDWSNRWEIAPLASLAHLRMDDEDWNYGPWLATQAANRLSDLGMYSPAELLYRRALEAHERVSGPQHPATLISVNNLGTVLLHKGDYAGAEPLYRRTLEASERTLGPNHRDTLISVNNLAELLGNKRDYAGAELLCRRALEAKERLFGPEHPSTLTSVSNLAQILRGKGDDAGAEPLCRRALEARERVLGPGHPDTLGSVNNLALLLDSKKDYAGAEPLHRRALEGLERALGLEHPLTLSSVNNLATVLSKRDYTVGESLHRKALEARERVLGPEHPDTLGSLNNLAILLDEKGDSVGAEPLYRRALQGRERVLGPEHPDTLTTVSNLASLLGGKKDYAAAEPLYRRAFEARERILGPEHPSTLSSVNDLGLFLTNKGDYSGAEPLCRRAFEGRQNVLGPEHPDTLISTNNLAALLKEKGDFAGAEPLYRRAFEASDRVLGPEHRDTLGSVNNLAALLFSKGDYAGAEPHYRRALEANERTLGPEHPNTLTTVNNLAALLYSKGDYASAEPLIRRALQGRERVLGPEHPHTLSTVNNLATLLDGRKDYARAEPLYRRALEGRTRVLGPEHPDTLASVNNLAALLFHKGDYVGAGPLYRRALEGRKRVLGPNHPDTIASVNNLALFLSKGKDAEEQDRLARRQDAIKRILSGDYSCAEALLRGLVQEKYALPSTHCHLARVLLMTGRNEEARQEINHAWDARKESPAYVVPRILFFQCVFKMLDAGDTAATVGQIKAALRAPDAHLEWAIQLVLDHLRGQLGEPNHQFLTALARALSSATAIPHLDEFPQWRTASAATPD
jgi:tetratricopeptide (TPR) repeat protein